LKDDPHRLPEDAAPLRADLFSAAHMAAHGRRLAALHRPAAQSHSVHLLDRLAGNAAVIAAACAAQSLAASGGAPLAPAAAWLLDHQYLIEEQIRLARSHLPRGYQRALPCVADDVRAQPRVHALALELVALGDGRIDADALTAFIAAYQESTPLALGELWAIPIMLRLALLDKLRQIAARLDHSEEDDGTAAANSIGSLRLLAGMDWRAFVETLSVVEQALRRDPAGVYAGMDFATRDQYRHAVERLARAGRRSESGVADAALALAGAAGADADVRARHVGYWLAGDGRAALERRLRLRAGPSGILGRMKLGLYLGAIGLLTCLFTGAIVLHAEQGGAGDVPLFALAVLGALGASQLALSLVNLLAARLVQPAPLPRLDFSAGIPPDAQTVVAVPALLYSAANVAALCQGLEVRYLANRDPALRFCLLTDLLDAPRQDVDGDAALVDSARAAIAALNDKYADAPFLLLHRRRIWSDGEGAWIGRERKRGKLEDLNAFLRQGVRTPFAVIDGSVEGLDATRYVITLDADTELPRDAARQCIATMAHPLNAPVLNAQGTRVVAGYGLLQPRVAPSLAADDASRWQRLCGGEPGIDPYTRAVSDVYQDLFGEGSFIGKGIYDLAVFERVLRNRFPDERVLSHDLLEGCHIRAGLLSDVQLHEACPARYGDDAGRRHRWIRGDWQLIGWLRTRVPMQDGSRAHNPLSALSRWKLFDNLRRSLVAPSLTALLLLCWSTLAAPAFWSAAVLAVWFLPVFVQVLIGLADRARALAPQHHLLHWAQDARSSLLHAVLHLSFLPYEAWYSMDAIVRTAWRMGVSRRRLLEWQPSSLARSGAGLEGDWRRMAFAPAFAVGTALLLSFADPLALFAAAPLLLVWFLSPVIAWWISLPLPQPAPAIGDTQQHFLRMLARRTWAFFEDHVTAADNWLPPDNLQEQPATMVAHRTSPTNIGLALLANLTAHDFGYLAGAGLLQRTRATLAAMARLERHRGHFFNWYDTRTLAPLPPNFVSTVDSGNLAGHLLTLATGLDELADAPVASRRALDGIRDTLGIVAGLGDGGAPAVRDALAALQRRLGPEYCRNTDTLPGLSDCLGALARAAAALEQATFEQALAQDAGADLRNWSAKLAAQCSAAHAELLHLAPWMRAEQAYVLDAGLTRIPTLRELADGATPVPAEPALAAMVRAGAANARARVAEISLLAAQARAFAAIDFGFLYHPDTRLLAIGYDASAHRLDADSYGLLASEARLASFVGIAQGGLPQEHWFAMGRQLTAAGGEQMLLSWNGTMFEYLMPLLVMPSYRGTLLDRTCRAVVHAQIDHGRRRGVPWGISESGYNAVDLALHYQYRAFGVPATGARRGLGDDLVIAPYASMLALMVAPEAACANLERMAALGFMGDYGFYEAVDYTPPRLPPGQSCVVVRSFMVHHQGMGLLALSHLLHGQPMQRRFEADPQCRATLALLQERVPRAVAAAPHTIDNPAPRPPTQEADTMDAAIDPAEDAGAPPVQLMSNGRYHVMVSAAGSGYSHWNDLALTRWRADPSSADGGLACYVRDLDSGALWSTTRQPTAARPDSEEALFGQGRAVFRRRDHGIALHTEIAVAPEDDIELRRIRIVNASPRARRIELTTYAEVVLAPPADDAAHPAFSKLFVQTEILAERGAILCTRRPKAPDEETPFLLNLMTVHGAQPVPATFETSRAAFIGRARGKALPAALTSDAPLGGSAGAVLDPVAAIRRSITLAPGQEITVDVVLGVAATREQAVQLVDKYQARDGGNPAADRTVEMAWNQDQALLRELQASEADAQLYGRLAGAVLMPQAALRADPAVIARNERGQSALWTYAISGDLPIVLLQIADLAHIALARELMQAHAWWRAKGLVADLVILCGDGQALHDRMMDLIAASPIAPVLDRPGGVFVRLLAQIPDEDRVLLQAVARVALAGEDGSLAARLARAAPPALPLPPPLASTHEQPAVTAQPLPQPALTLDNGTGGFSADGREYIIRTAPDRPTPAPWTNVLASPMFGSVISESGQAYSWNQNAHEFRLTPWHNDPVSDSGGEAYYLRDEDSGVFWSPTALPAPSGAGHLTRHGFGYSVFEHSAHGIHSELLTYVALDAPLKHVVLKLRNEGARHRRLSVTGYVEWVLGALREQSALHVVTERDAASGALFARNAYNTDFAGRVAFFHLDADQVAFTCDRLEFIGQGGSLAKPASLARAGLSGRSGAALDPCAALQTVIELAPGGEREVRFMLGVGGRRNLDASNMVRRHSGAQAAHDDFARMRGWWDETLGAVRIETPEPALDAIANGWLMYQTVACRLWARSGYYQSGGAYGFRDQLQDAMATVHARPELLRDHVLLFAGHQFVDGDVQHWWHPPLGRGVRTRCSDDYLWLPLAVCRYVSVTGDVALMDRIVPFIEGRALDPGESSAYELPEYSPHQASLYEHCVRAIRRALVFGGHGLPLMGSGDWNDGMDRVGIDGKGESVWLGFFLHEVLQRFAELADRCADYGFATTCRSAAQVLAHHIEENAWDGEWYRRAWFDDGTPLGSHRNAECRIDAVAQSWSVLSGAADPARTRAAMAALDAHLVRREDGLIRLLDPPFDDAEPDPGYIRGYPPGVRENGGQYTHAAIWAAMAFARMGESERAWELLRMINPVNHALDAAACARYMVEPYVMTADVVAAAPHVGRGGWSWYTGSAGWMQRLIVESLLGVTRSGERLALAPQLPAAWDGFRLHYRFGAGTYTIDVRTGPEAALVVDGVPQQEASIALVDDGQPHAVMLTIVRGDDAAPAPDQHQDTSCEK
jgi:cyclic beta-1,2-glucan synthetase